MERMKTNTIGETVKSDWCYNKQGFIVCVNMGVSIEFINPKFKLELFMSKVLDLIADVITTFGDSFNCKYWTFANRKRLKST